MSAKEKILKSLKKGTLTVKQAQSRFGIANVSARVNELRNDGYPIATNRKVTKSGDVTYFYSLN